MHAVFRFIKNDGRWGLKDRIGRLNTSFSRKTVHKKRLLPGRGHEGVIHLKTLEVGFAHFRLILLPHGRPNVRIDDVRTPDRG